MGGASVKLGTHLWDYKVRLSKRNTNISGVKQPAWRKLRRQEQSQSQAPAGAIIS